MHFRKEVTSLPTFYEWLNVSGVSANLASKNKQIADKAHPLISPHSDPTYSIVYPPFEKSKSC